MPELRTNLKPNTHVAYSPLTYSIESMTFISHRGEEIDVQRIISSFSIKESLYFPTMILEMSFKDSANFIEQYEICGQEKIVISLVREKEFDSEKETLKHTFYVTEYPVYSRASEHIQVYKIRAVSEHFYISSFKEISRAMNGNIIDVIREIYTNDLFVPVEDISILNSEKSNPCVSIFKGIIPRMRPIQAIDWLRQKAYSTSSSPFFISENSQEGVSIASLEDLISRDVFREYYYNTRSSGVPNDEDDYITIATKVFDIVSNLGLANSFFAERGAYASDATFCDIYNKTLRTENYTVDDMASDKLIENHVPLSSTFKIKDVVNSQRVDASISRLSTACSKTIPINTGNPNLYANLGQYHNLRAQGEYELLESFTHDIRVAGDFRLYPGRMIHLHVPKPIDPDMLDGGVKVDDQLVSGKYLITGVTHDFDSQYHCTLRLKRNSTRFSL